MTTETPNNSVTEISREIDLNKRPNIRLLYTISDSPELTQCRDQHDAWVAGMAESLPLDAFGEGSRQIVTSSPNPKGETASLHLLSTSDQQKPHIHIPPTTADHTDTTSFQKATSNRFLYVLTGAKEGRVEWFMPNGEMELGQDTDGQPFAKGTAGKNPCYAMTIPPYSAALVEMQGGVHNFTNIAAYSYHMQNVANIAPEKGDDLTRNTFEWRGEKPEETIELKASGADMEIHNLAEIEAANVGVANKLAKYVNLGASDRTPSCMLASIVYGVFGYDNPRCKMFDWSGNGGACAPDESPARINSGYRGKIAGLG